MLLKFVCVYFGYENATVGIIICFTKYIVRVQFKNVLSLCLRRIIFCGDISDLFEL